MKKLIQVFKCFLGKHDLSEKSKVLVKSKQSNRTYKLNNTFLKIEPNFQLLETTFSCKKCKSIRIQHKIQSK